MVLTYDQSVAIQEDFLAIFKERYGDAWRESLTKQLRPSPIPALAEQRGVSIADVRKIRSQMRVLGLFFELYKDLISQSPTTYSTQ
jgi:hypothetical protein